MLDNLPRTFPGLLKATLATYFPNKLYTPPKYVLTE